MAAFSSSAFAVSGFSPGAFDFGSTALAWSEARKAAGRRWRLVPEPVRDSVAAGRWLAFEARRTGLLASARRRYLVRS